MASPDSSSASRYGQESLESTLSNGKYGQAAHTLTACCRCRQRKTRCDANLPRCGPCERNNSYCEYFDAAKGRKMPRSYVVRLQDRVRELEEQLSVFQETPEDNVDPETIVRGAGLVRIQGNDEPSYLGPSSGINMTRLVLELAKGIRKIQKIKDLVPEEQARRIRERFETESKKPTSKDYPEVSSVAAPNLPSLELTNILVETFFQKGQYLYPLLHEPSFRQLLINVYQGSVDPYENFALRMVIALSMQKLSSQWTGLADSYYLAALPYLESNIRRRDLGTIQCFMLIAQYSIVTPTRTAANWIMVLAVKLCQELGITQESTIGIDLLGNPLDPLEIDMRRRCYWICLAMEYGLAHSMGRPSAFGMSHEHMNVRWFQTVDDDFITRNEIFPGPASIKKRIAKHFITIRLLQLEIRRTLYLKRRPTPLNDTDPWFIAMEQKLHDWIADIPESSDGTAYDREWPSPQVPEPSVNAARKAFEASKTNIETQRRQIDEHKVDLSWIFCQALFMAINTVLWAVSYADIRKENSREQVSQLVTKALETAFFCSLKWPGVEGAMELYGTLCHTCLKAYDGDTEKSYSLGSPINRPSPTVAGSPDPVSSPLSLDSSHIGTFMASGPPSPDAGSVSSSQSNLPVTPLRSGQPFTNHLSPEAALQKVTARSTPGDISLPVSSSAFNNPLPPIIGPDLGALAPGNIYSPIFQPYTSLAYDVYPGAAANENGQSQALIGLDLQQQSELMTQLENGRLAGMFD